MELIVTHENADFDAIASLLAAQKLYPDAQIVFGQRMSGALRDFISLHKDRLNALPWNEVEPAKVTRLIVVDVRKAGRLKHVDGVLKRIAAGEPVDVHIYDHHPASEDDLSGSLEVIEPVGSATTLLVEHIRRQGLTLDNMEATLLALGIHTDTGSLTYGHTTVRDAEALTWLLHEGLSLPMLNRYLRDPPSERQRAILSRLLDQSEDVQIDGVTVAIASLELDKAPGGLADIVTHLLELEGPPALFALFGVKNQVQVIARSKFDWIDVGGALASLGGGGHAQAAAATVKGATVAEVRERLVAYLKAHPPKPHRVRDLMSSPVRTVDISTPLVELEQSLRHWRHTGVPVMKEGRMVGIVSRRDVIAARQDGRLHLSVGSCMSQNVKTTTPGASLESALQQMVDADVGRLPVLKEGRLVGIITRADLLRYYYGEEQPADESREAQ